MSKIHYGNLNMTFEAWINYIKTDVIDIQDIDQFMIDEILFHAKHDLTKLGLQQLELFLLKIGECKN